MAQGGGGQVALLEAAHALQEELVASAPDGGTVALQRLTEIERGLAEAHAEELERQIRAEQAEAEQALEDGQVELAAEKMRLALRRQQEINRSAAGSRRKNFLRQGQLELALAELEARPLAAEVEGALATAREAAAREDWRGALAAFTAAREGQLRLNRDYAQTRYANAMRLGEIEGEVASLDAADLAAEVDALEAQGDVAAERGDAEEAVGAFAQAIELQLQLNQDYTKSQFLSSARVEQLERKRQTAASGPRLAQIRAQERAIGRHLARREVLAATALIAEAAAAVEKLHESLPRSAVLDPDLRLKLAYLASQGERLGEVQDAVVARLRPLPGVGELWLLQTEVPQALYLQVMKTNPSRHPGRAFPVDSVNWFEARQFCERLGWLLGRPVRLPTRDEFAIAVGGAAERERLIADLPAEAGQESRPMAEGEATADGFYDLLGNLAEWLEAADSDRGMEPAPVVGGSYLDGAAALAALPATAMPRSERARHVGFRVVVEMSESAESTED